MQALKPGTLIEDNGQIGIIARVIRMGKMDFDNDLITWRNNYEIHYLDGTVAVMGVNAFARLVEEGKIQVIKSSGTTPLPPFYPATGGDD
tara:strand:- start:417 stop:686 length:270 start_codon:yes stop_codon:yes gene_type:complete